MKYSIIHVVAVTATSILTALMVSFLPGALGSPYVLKDDRVRSLDVTPVLGRGYSIMTNTFLSTCLEGALFTTPSYNYDYSFIDLTQTSNIIDELAGELQDSFAYDFLKDEVNTNTQETSVSSTKKNYVISTMSIERYYSSVQEEVSPLSPEAKTLLESKDYIGFFMACGSNYIRSIRRKQEVATVFMFKSTSNDLSGEFAQQLRVNGDDDESAEPDPRYDSITSSLEIKILGYGLGLNQEGSGTLVATSLGDYNDVMRFAFKAMTQSAGGAAEVGMVFGVEVVPWVDNIQFQVNANLHTESIEVPLKMSLLPRALNRDDIKNTDFRNTNVGDVEDNWYCAEPAYFIDRHGYCCEVTALYNLEKGVYDSSVYADSRVEDRVCRPIRVLDKSIVKNNMANNGEFVVRLDQIMRLKLNQFSLLEKCMSETVGLSNRFNRNIVKQQASSTFDPAFFDRFSLLEMKLALNPLGDFGVLTHYGFELDEYLEMFYQKCIAALFGLNQATESNYFMADVWTTHPDCMKLSCLSAGNRWKRDGSGCTPGILAGTGATPYGVPGVDDRYCSTIIDPNGDNEVCKHNTTELGTFLDNSLSCWTEVFSSKNSNSTTADIFLADGTTSIEYILNNFCYPSLQGNTLEAGLWVELTTAAANNCTFAR